MINGLVIMHPTYWFTLHYNIKLYRTYNQIYNQKYFNAYIFVMHKINLYFKLFICCTVEILKCI